MDGPLLWDLWQKAFNFNSCSTGETMTPESALEMFQRMMLVTFEITAPILGAGLVVGILVSIFQTATQINDPILGFVPKLIAMMAAMWIFGGWITEKMILFGQEILGNLASVF